MIFNSLVLKNFKSYGDYEQTVELNHVGIKLISAVNGAGKCVAKGTKITTKEFGEINIENLFPTDTLPNDIYNLEKEIHIKTDEGWKLIELLFVTEEQEMYELQLENGNYLKCSGLHRIMSSRGWVFAKDLTENDEIICV